MERAAKKIQAFYRGILARRRFRDLLKQFDEAHNRGTLRMMLFDLDDKMDGRIRNMFLLNEDLIIKI